jgi:hypothetical protein
MKIDFTREEMASFLTKQDYEVTFEKREVLFPTRYNDLDEKVIIDTCSIFRNNEPYMYHLFDPERPFQWLEMVFEEEMKNKLLNL